MSWRVIWRQGGRRQSETFPTELQARRFAQLVEGHGNRWPPGWIRGEGFGEPGPAGGITVRDWCEQELGRNTRANERTRGDYGRDLRNHVYPVIGALPLAELDDDQAAALVHGLAAKGLSPKTVANVHGTISTLIAAAVQRGLLARNPLAGRLPDAPTVRTEEMVFLQPGEVDHLIAAVRAVDYGGLGDRWARLVRLLYGTGLRWSEATALQTFDVDMMARRRALHVRRAWKRDDAGRFYLGEPKTRRARRTLGLSDELLEVLIPLVAAADPGGLVFVSAMGRPVRHSSFWNRVWLPAVERAGLPRRPRIHDLRHSHASWLIGEGHSLYVVQRRLGHESITTTVDRYGHLAPDADDAVNASVDRALRAGRSADAFDVDVDV